MITARETLPDMVLSQVLLTYVVSRKILHKVNVVPKQLAGILGGRGAIGIVIASEAFSEGFMSEAGFSLVISATLIIALIIPFLFVRKTVDESSYLC